MNGTVATVAHIERVSNAFLSMLLDMASRLGTDADWHLAVMSVESGLRPEAVNPNGGATGLIQFMPATARHLGTTTADLFDMSAEEQLEYVEKYYHPFAGKMHSVEDVYMATFMPSMVGRGSDNVISTEGEAVYEANKGFDRNGDGVITNGEVGATARNVLAAAASRPRIQVTHEEVVPGAPLAVSPLDSEPSSEPITPRNTCDDDIEDPYAE
jgi:hypothetical protein